MSVAWTKVGKLDRYNGQADAEGYTMERVADRLWNVTDSKGTVVAKGETRKVAQAAFTAFVSPDPYRLSVSEYNALTAVNNNNNLNAVIAESGNPASTLGKVQTLLKRGMISIEGVNVNVTDEGRKALSVYVPREPGMRADGTPRKSGAESKYGPRPGWAGDRVSDSEYEVARVSNATASLEFAIVVARKHPYSPLAADKLRAAIKRIGEVIESAERERGGSTITETEVAAIQLRDRVIKEIVPHLVEHGAKEDADDDSEE